MGIVEIIGKNHCKLCVSPPWMRPHGFWYVSGPAGCGAATGFWRAYIRYALRALDD